MKESQHNTSESTLINSKSPFTQMNKYTSNLIKRLKMLAIERKTTTVKISFSVRLLQLSNYFTCNSIVHNILFLVLNLLSAL